MNTLISEFKNKKIHIVGVTGSEGSSVLRLFSKLNIAGEIITHDFIQKNKLEKSFKLWHKNLSTEEKNRLFHKFIKDLSKTQFYCKKNYLKNIDKADIIFVPQSWRLYSSRNKRLFELNNKKFPFHSLTRLYLEFSPTITIAITGTVGKGSVANMLVQFLKDFGKKVYFAGNETWMNQVADKIPEMKKNDILVLEVSHRQIQDGFKKSANIVVITNIYPNHLDEVEYEKYKDLKLSLLKKQTKQDFAILNFDCEELKGREKEINSKIFYYSQKDKLMNTKNVQKIYSYILNTKSDQYYTNILAVSTILDVLNFNISKVPSKIKQIKPLIARMQLLAKKNGIIFYNDIKSTTPWATIKAMNKESERVILVTGGDTKGIKYDTFWQKISTKASYIYCLRSGLADSIPKSINRKNIEIIDSLQEAVLKAYKRAKKNEKIIVSPAAAFFYTKFIKGQKSLRKIITSLPPKEQD